MRCSEAALLLLSSEEAAAALFRPIIDLPDFFLPPETLTRERERMSDICDFMGVPSCHNKLPGVPLEPLAEGDRDEDDELKRNDGAEFFFLASK